MKKRFSILLLLLTICFMTSHAQQMPITVTPVLTPPYTPSLSRMCESGSTSLMVNVFVNDVTASDLQLRLHLKLESTGITIESVSKAPVRPISVGGGEARVLMGSDLADVLSLNNLTFKGYDKAAYIKTGALPGGVWRLTAWLEHYHTGRILSNKGTAMAVIASYPPPVLTSPKNYEVTTGDMSKPIVFTWNASKFMGGTASLLYTLEMWEMHTDGVPAEAVVASQSPIYTSAPTAGLSHTLIPTSLAMEPGRKYCWRVTVSDPSGKAHIQNSGRSEVRVFQYLEKCPDICELNVTVRDVTATATWDVDTRHKGGWNVEMYDDAGTYHETLWTGNNNTGEQMFDYGTKWHVRVQGVCQGGQVSAWSEWKDFQIAERFTTPKRDDGTPYECGEFAEPRVITNMEEKELKKGDIIENERGTTKYEIYSATKNDDGSYRGLSYIILSVWNCKVLGEYDNLKVNTDGVNISNFSWRSKKSDLLMADPDAIKQWTEELAKDIAGATYNNTIKETIKLDDISFETIVHKDGKYYAIVKDGNGNILDPVDITYSVDGKKRVAIEGKDGKQLVIDKDGEMMGVEEYKYCGGSALLLKQHNAEKDSLMGTKGIVTFDKVEGEPYGFDKWRGEDYDKEQYPTITDHNEYRPSYMGIEKGNEVKVKASYTKCLTFKNERGVPLIADKENNTLTFNAGMSDLQAIYAYDDTTVVGKLNVQAYSYKDVKVHLVRVNNTKTLDLGKIEKGVNDIWQQAVVKYTFDELEPITIDYANKEHFVHGGKGTFQNYNADQKTAIKALPEGVDGNDYYLFFVDCYDRLDTAGIKSNEPVSGYMPVGRHYGFIYNEFNNTRTIAHELGHGVNTLHHTFSDDSESFHTTAKTDNLMDYNGGTALNHKQWQWSHEKHRNVLGFLDGEEESESIIDNSTLIAVLEAVRNANKQEKREADITLYSNKDLIGNNVKLQDDIVLEYLSIKIMTGKNIGTEDSPFLFEPLLIYPDILHIEDVETPKGQVGDFVQVFYNRLEKTSIVQTEPSESTNMAISIVVNKSQLDDIKGYLLGISSYSNFKLYEGENEKESNSIMYISAEPRMPDVRASVESDGEIKMQLKIEYMARKTWPGHNNELVRNDITHFPSDNSASWKELNSGEIWDIDFGDKYRGGRAVLYCKIDKQVVDSVVFHIRGKNPTLADVLTYAQTIDSSWYVPKIIRQESSGNGNIGKQFNTGTPSVENQVNGMPCWGYPYGWGLKQLDNLGSPLGYYTAFNNRYGASPDELWNWKMNVQKGLQLFNSCKLTDAKNKWNKQLSKKEMNEWLRFHDALDSYPMKIESSTVAAENGTIVTEIIAGSGVNTETIVSEETPQGNNRSLIDADAIRRYNGGSYYDKLEVPKPKSDETPKWIITKTNESNLDYINEVCGKQGW